LPDGASRLSFAPWHAVATEPTQRRIRGGWRPRGGQNDFDRNRHFKHKRPAAPPEPLLPNK
jgi:hypothetical protein